MHEHIATNKQNLTQKFHKNLKSFQNPKKFQETPKLRSKCVKCMKNEGLRDHTKGEMHYLGRNPSGEDEKSEKRVFGERERDSFSVKRDMKR